jgi:hypothetical protein
MSGGHTVLVGSAESNVAVPSNGSVTFPNAGPRDELVEDGSVETLQVFLGQDGGDTGYEVRLTQKYTEHGNETSRRTVDTLTDADKINGDTANPVFEVTGIFNNQTELDVADTDADSSGFNVTELAVAWR